MHFERRAVVDVGTNSIKLLVADVSSTAVQPIFEDSKQTRLGAGFYESRELQPEAINRTVSAVAKFAQIARWRQASWIRIIATSATREARNSHELVKAIHSATGLVVEIISGKQEADWVFQGVASDPALAGGPMVLLDVGGGSTEIIIGRGLRKMFSRSFALGTVRLMELFPHSDPPTARERSRCRKWINDFVRVEIQPQLKPALAKIEAGHDGSLRVIGTGGTATILARMDRHLADYDRASIEAARLTKSGIGAQVKHLWSLPLKQRKKIPGLPGSRADVILTGALIYESIMGAFGFRKMQASTRGLRFAALISRRPSS